MWERVRTNQTDCSTNIRPVCQSFIPSLLVVALVGHRPTWHLPELPDWITSWIRSWRLTRWLLMTAAGFKEWILEEYLLSTTCCPNRLKHLRTTASWSQEWSEQLLQLLLYCWSVGSHSPNCLLMKRLINMLLLGVLEPWAYNSRAWKWLINWAKCTCVLLPLLEAEELHLHLGYCWGIKSMKSQHCSCTM